MKTLAAPEVLGFIQNLQLKDTSVVKGCSPVLVRVMQDKDL